MADKVVDQQKNKPIDVGKQALAVTVASSEKTFYEGRARSISSVNSVGPFDILPQHENFVSLISKKVTIFDAAGKKYEYAILHGLLEVSGDIVRVFIGV